MVEIILEAKNITITYDNGHTPIKIEKNNFTCLLGASGIGKTTLLKALCGFIKPSSGEIIFKNNKLTKPTPNIILLFQENNLFPWLNVEQNISLGMKIQGIQGSDSIEELLKITKLDSSRKLYPHQLSGGMRKRTSIARAISCNPEIILLDEPFSSIDQQLKDKMCDFLIKMQEMSDTTFLMVTHNQDEANKLSNTQIHI